MLLELNEIPRMSMRIITINYYCFVLIDAI